MLNFESTTVLTNAQTVAFFTADQMAIPGATFDALASEGIASVGDLVNFDKDNIAHIA